MQRRGLFAVMVIVALAALLCSETPGLAQDPSVTLNGHGDFASVRWSGEDFTAWLMVTRTGPADDPSTLLSYQVVYTGPWTARLAGYGVIANEHFVRQGRTATLSVNTCSYPDLTVVGPCGLVAVEWQAPQSTPQHVTNHHFTEIGPYGDRWEYAGHRSWVDGTAEGQVVDELFGGAWSPVIQASVGLNNWVSVTIWPPGKQ